MPLTLEQVRARAHERKAAAWDKLRMLICQMPGSGYNSRESIATLIDNETRKLEQALQRDEAELEE